ncbi:MAG: hydrogenase formation protein HypD [Proteobacteria bacterium]|jgi:hydrogenase expression/formation protein HypD|nr:hydrogenase formation protein HypD [Pseudomonadota bacterium]
MKYLDGYRDPDAARYIAKRIRDAAERLARVGRTVRLMEICGTHTMAIARHGIRDVLPENVVLCSGPGCPVCVTDAGYVDAAIELAGRGVTIASFGDMLRVPGTERSLSEARAEGARVVVCYSPAEALALARRDGAAEVVFLAVGFETTVAPLAALLGTARAGGASRFSMLTAFKTVPPALVALAEDPEVAVDAFLCPAHVSAVIGARAYAPFAERYGIPCTIAGFEPLDILLGIQDLLEQLADGEARVVNQYRRVVKDEGNAKARRAIAEALEPADAVWRGIGVIPGSGLAIREELAAFDAARVYGVTTAGRGPDPGCQCGDVLKGKILPDGCAMFGGACTPDHPVGPCMVSGEGSCAAYYKYSR